jgi:molecular chaperone DnaJ
MATPTRDPYEVLGVPRDADETQIKKAFRKLARELHPDVNRHDPDAEDKFKEAAEAYEILNDAERRALYDRYGHEGLRSGGYQPNFEGFGSISDLFDAFFGGGGFGGGGGGFGGFGGVATGPAQGRDIAVQAEVTLAEAATGTSVELSFEAIETCEVCHGNGAKPGTPIVTCERCGGVGVLQAVTRSPFGQVMRQMPCDVCGGEGKVPSVPCEHCDGRGREVRRRTLRVDVPAGIADGQRIRLSGRGHAGERGGPPGDLYVLVRIQADERFLRDGDDLVTMLEISAPVAMVGARLPVASLDGEVEVEVPAGTQPGEIFVVRGEGMPRLRRPGRRGDLRVVANVVVPRRLSRDQRKLAERLADTITEENVRTDESIVGKLKRLLGG